MNKMVNDLSQIKLINSALSFFIGDYVMNVYKGETLSFVTSKGARGTVEHNPYNNSYEIMINEEVIYEIEENLYTVISFNHEDDIFELYEYIKTIDKNEMKHRSTLFLNIIHKSVENILLNMNLPIRGQAKVKSFDVFFTKYCKVKISLN